MQLPLADEPVEALLSADDFHGHRAADVKAAKPQEEAFEPDLALGAPELVVSYQEEVSCRRLKTIVLLVSAKSLWLPARLASSQAGSCWNRRMSIRIALSPRLRTSPASHLAPTNLQTIHSTSSCVDDMPSFP